MRITNRFTIAVHIITATDYFDESLTVTSGFLAGSVGVNPVTVRTVLGKLRNAGIIKISQGKSGIHLAASPDKISLYDVYKAVCGADDDELFRFHENPNAKCPVGRNIHKVMDKRLSDIKRAMEESLKKTTLAEIIEDTRREIEKG